MNLGSRLPGDYLVEYLRLDTYELVQRPRVPSYVPSVPVTVDFTAAADPPIQGVLTTDKLLYSAYEPIVVDWTGMTAVATDFVAIVPESAPDDNMVAFEYNGGVAAGSVTFNLVTAGGDYEARFFTANSYAELNATSFDIDWQDEDAPRVYCHETSVTASGPMPFTYDNVPPQQLMYMGVTNAGSPYSTPPLGWSWLPVDAFGDAVDTASGAIPTGTLTNGTYEIRLYDQHDAVIAYDYFEVEDPAPTHAQLVPVKPYFHQDWDSQVDVDFVNLDGHARDRVGLLPMGPTLRIRRATSRSSIRIRRRTGRWCLRCRPSRGGT